MNVDVMDSSESQNLLAMRSGCHEASTMLTLTPLCRPRVPSRQSVAVTEIVGALHWTIP